MLDHSTKIITEVDLIQEHLKPYSVKSRGNFKWVESMINHYCESYSLDKKDIANMETNINLLKGKGISSDHLTEYLNSLNGDFNIGLNYESVPNYDIIGTIANHMIGHLRRQSLKPQVIDVGPTEGSERKTFMLEQVQAWLQENVISRYRQQASDNVLRKYGVEDPLSLSPEEQMELQFEMENEFKAMSPSRLDDYMRKDYMSPTSKLLNGLMKYLLREYDIKSITDDNFAISLGTAREVYYSGIRGDQLVFEPVDLRGFTYGADDSCRWIQDGQWWVRRQQLPAVEIISRYDLKESDLRKMAEVGSSTNRLDYLENLRLISEIPDDQELKNINLRTREGKYQYERIKQKYGVGLSTNMFEVAHVAFKTFDDAKFVVRIVNGKKRGFYASSDYQFRPELDRDIRDVKVPIIMEGTRIQVGGDYIFVEKQPLPYTNRSIEDPYKITGPYIGGVYNKMMGMGEVVSQIDLGKPYQYQYNIVKAKMEEDRATDYGKILPLLVSLMPDDYTLPEWLNSIKQEKILPIADNAYRQGTINYSELQYLRSIDLSNVDKIASRIQELESIRLDAMRAMGYTAGMLGQASPYESVANNQANVSLAMNQTESIFTFHDKIVEKALTHFMQNAIIYFKDKPIKSSLILDDMSRAVLDLDLSSVHFANIGLYISNTNRDTDLLNLAKSRLEPLANAGLLRPEGYVKLLTADSMMDVYNILRENERRMEEAAARERQAQMEMQQQQAQAEAAAKEREYQHEIRLLDRRNIATLNAAELNAQLLERANDVNSNKINDANERLEKELSFKREEASRDQMNNDLDRELERLRLEIERLKVENMTRRSGS